MSFDFCLTYDCVLGSLSCVGGFVIWEHDALCLVVFYVAHRIAGKKLSVIFNC